MDILPTCVRNGMGTANFSPLEQGILTGKYSGGTVPEGSRGSIENQNMWMREHIANVDMLDRVDSMKPIAEKYGLSLAQLSLAWILHNTGISSVIMGATSVRQLEDNVKASGVELDQADYDHISDLFPVEGAD